MKQCKVNNCTNDLYCKGYCIKHYRQVQRYGRVKERTRQDKNEIVLHESYAEILLYNRDCEVIGKSKIDLDSIHLAKKYKWCLQGDGYLTAGNNRNITLHRLLLGDPPNLVVDHINGDKLDNRLSNLRLATQQQNCFNRTITNSKTGVKGVYICNKTGKYKASIGVNGEVKYLGVYSTLEEAKTARLKAEHKYFGEFKTKV